MEKPFYPYGSIFLIESSLYMLIYSYSDYYALLELNEPSNVLTARTLVSNGRGGLCKEELEELIYFAFPEETIYIPIPDTKPYQDSLLVMTESVVK